MTVQYLLLKKNGVHKCFAGLYVYRPVFCFFVFVPVIAINLKYLLDTDNSYQYNSIIVPSLTV